MNVITCLKQIIYYKFNKKILIEFNAYEIDLMIKALWLGYNSVDNEKLLFKNKENDKDKLFYLHRLLSSEANKFFYNKLNNEFFTVNL